MVDEEARQMVEGQRSLIETIRNRQKNINEPHYEENSLQKTINNWGRIKGEKTNSSPQKTLVDCMTRTIIIIK